MLSYKSKMDVRRHLRIPFSGLATAGFQAGIRTLFQSGQLEFYMNNLQAEEEASLTGQPLGMFKLLGPIAAGQTITVTINGTPVLYAVTSSDALSYVPLQSVAMNVSNAINAANLGVTASGGALLATAPQAQQPGFAQVSLIGLTTFTLAAASTGGLAVAVIYNGSVFPDPQITFTDDNGAQTLYGYIAICNYLQAQTVTASTNLGLLQADVVRFRPYEIAQRAQLYDYWREQLGRVLSVGPDAWGFRGNLTGGGSVV